jgi:hypothetical protein
VEAARSVCNAIQRLKNIRIVGGTIGALFGFMHWSYYVRSVDRRAFTRHSFFIRPVPHRYIISNPAAAGLFRGDGIAFGRRVFKVF